VNFATICVHTFFKVRHKFRQYRRLEDNFSENYNLKYSSKIQACHFGASQQQFTLHTSVVYKADRSYWSFASISSSLQHGPPGICSHLDPVCDKRRLSRRVTHFFSDGPTTQYRNKTNFYLSSTKLLAFTVVRGTFLSRHMERVRQM